MFLELVQFMEIFEGIAQEEFIDQFELKTYEY